MRVHCCIKKIIKKGIHLHKGNIYTLHSVNVSEYGEYLIILVIKVGWSSTHLFPLLSPFHLPAKRNQLPPETRAVATIRGVLTNCKAVFIQYV